MSETPEIVQCIVKWFNNRKGFGFLTTLDEAKLDIFVHYSGITSGEGDDVYKTLVEGEYVECVLSTEKTEDGKVTAQNVTGIRGGPLLCHNTEKRVLLVSRTSQDDDENTSSGHPQRNTRRRHGTRGGRSDSRTHGSRGGRGGRSRYPRREEVTETRERETQETNQFAALGNDEEDTTETQQVSASSTA